MHHEMMLLTLGVLQVEVFVWETLENVLGIVQAESPTFKFVSIDRFSSGSVPSGNADLIQAKRETTRRSLLKVPALKHELIYCQMTIPTRIKVN